MYWLGKLIIGYLVLAGILLHVIVAAGAAYRPDLVKQAEQFADKAMNKIRQSHTGVSHNHDSPQPKQSINAEIRHNFEPWQPLENIHPKARQPFINSPDNTFQTLTDAIFHLNQGDTLYIPPGVYRQGIAVTQPNISLIGLGHVVIENTAIQDKGAIVTQADNTLIRNIECRGIFVVHKNGACVRHEANNLTLEHVYFHSSQEGVLSGNISGHVKIVDSRFENLGAQGGQAHGIYIGSGTLKIDRSIFLASLSQGHEIKSRAASTIIRNSVIASLSANDSRLIDIPNGGKLFIENSVLQQGTRSANQDMIGYGLEFRSYDDNQVKLINNTILMERLGANVLLNSHHASPEPIIENNRILAKRTANLPGKNTLFKSREAMGLTPYPALPARNTATR